METTNLLDLQDNVPAITGLQIATRFEAVQASVDSNFVRIERAPFPWVSSIIFVVVLVLLGVAISKLHSRFPSKIEIVKVNFWILTIVGLTVICVIGWTTLEFLAARKRVSPLAIDLHAQVISVPSLALSIPTSNVVELRAVTGLKSGQSLAECDATSELQLIFKMDEEPQIKCLVIAATSGTIAPFQTILTVWKSKTGIATRHFINRESIRDGWSRGLPWSK